MELAKLHATAIDDRMGNVRFQQEQLLALHRSIQGHRQDIISAIVADSGATANQAESEVAFTAAIVGQYYGKIDFDEALETEYRIARGKDSPLRRVGHGVVLLRLTTHTRIFSIMSVVACAIAAGNAIAIECNGEDVITKVLTSVMKPLDREIYALLHEPVTNSEFLATALIVDQTEQLDSPNCIRSRPDLRAIALIDRTADLDLAARHIVASHAGYTGQSPHSPEIVLVNEWVKKPFIEALTRAQDELLRETEAHQLGPKSSQTMEKVEAMGGAHLLRTRHVNIMDVETRSPPILRQRAHGEYLIMLTTMSLVDAVLALSDEPEYLVAYHFSTPEVGKFWSQQINSHATFINHIPADLLLGPALAVNQPIISTSPRYTTTMLSRSWPEIIEPNTKMIVGITDFHSLTAPIKEKINKQTNRALEGTGQGPGTAIGFFEQGIMVGAACIVLPVLSMVEFTGWTLISYAAARYRQ